MRGSAVLFLGLLVVGCGKTVTEPTAIEARITCNGAPSSCDVSFGDSVTISWWATGADTCRVDPTGWTGTEGTQSLTGVSETVTYSLSCGGRGAADTASATVKVNVGARPAPPTVEIFCNGTPLQCSVGSGSTVTISWASANAEQCTVDPGGWSGTSGTRAVTVVATTKFVARCQGAEFAASGEVSVNVAPVEPPSPPAPSPAPTVSLLCNGAPACTVTANSTATIAWTSRNASSCSIAPGGWSGTSGTQPITPGQSTTYEARCTGAGGTVSASVTVTVTSDIPGGPGAPTIEFTSVPPIGSNADLQGRVLHVRPREHAVAVYIRVQGGFWSKPTFASPTVGISAGGAWIADITTGGNDAQATDVVAFLVKSGYTPPLASGSATLPIDVNGTTVLARVSVTR